MTQQQLTTARRWRKAGYTFQAIADQLGLERQHVMESLSDRLPRELRGTRQKQLDRMAEAVVKLRSEGYSEAVIAANFGRQG